MADSSSSSSSSSSSAGNSNTGSAASPHKKNKLDLEWLCINTIRVLAADMVQECGSGHPGAPMGGAPFAHVLFSRIMRFSPKNPNWFQRDRFVLSNGHGCALQYILLHLYGYDVSLDDLKHLRKIGSKTPGHPEAHHTPGVEVTTGPLGQGVANAVGLAIAESHLAAHFNREGFPIFSNYTYVVCGDGCMQEGVASEACSLAGHLGLGRLIMIYDDNHVQIDGSTDLAFTEDVVKRFEAYGWHTQSLADGDSNLEGIEKAIHAAREVKDKPSLIRIRTTIGFGSTKQGTEKVHGAALGDKDVVEVKKRFNFDPEKKFVVSEEVRSFFEPYISRGQAFEKETEGLLARYEKAHPDLHVELKRRLASQLPTGWKDILPQYSPSDPAKATRQFSQTALNRLAPVIPEIVGGSADLTGSNLTFLDCSHDYQRNTPDGRYFRFGVREHGMAAICNGMAAYGCLIPFGATFLNFIGYAQGAVRLSALSHFGVIYIMTHDSIGLGEDGPTHQPIEILTLLRATPNLLTVRPADGNEVSGAYAVAIENRHRPTVLSLTRQNVPNLAGSSIEKVAKGGYILQDVENPDVALLGTGSELSICVDAANLLAKEGIRVRVISFPCTELFDEQSEEYRSSVLAPSVPVVSVEAASTNYWARYAHASIGINTFGSSGAYKDVYKLFELYPEKIAEKTKKVAVYYKSHPVFPLVHDILH